MTAYPSEIEFVKADDAWEVSFPDLDGCFTYGETLEEAKYYAKEALTGYLESIDARKLKIPRPSGLKGKNIHYISPEKEVAFAIWLKLTRQKQGLTQKDIAAKLGIRYQTYQRIENPEKTNPTLKTILKLEEVLGERIVR